jgi:photosystem II stability/assembly factor-like uncharacterized protein
MKNLLQTLFFFLLVTQICFAQWVNAGLDGYSIKDIAVQDSIIFAITSDTCYLNGQGITCCGKLFSTTDNGYNWTMIVDSNVVDIAISPSGKIFMIKGGTAEWEWGDSLYSSFDNGNTWLAINIMEQLIASIPVGKPQNISISPEGIIYCGIHWPGFGMGDVLAKSTDDGITWTTPGTGVLSGKLYDYRDQFVITVGEFRCISTCPFKWDMYLSSDYGNTWEHLEECTMSDDPQFVALFSNGNIVIDDDTLGFVTPKGIYLSTDMCSTWTQISSIDCQVGLSLPSGFSEGMLVGTSELGVFLFSDMGDSLGARNEGLTNLNIHTLTLDNNGYVYAGTGNGVWRRPLSEVTAVEKNLIEVPSSYFLLQNYPNPFNPNTKIKYSLPQTSQVQIKAFDVLGNEIETLVNEEKPVGTYELTWNAEGLPSGVYFYQLKAGEYINTKKMILIK